MELVRAVGVLADLLSVSITLMEKSLNMAQIISQAQNENRDLSEDEWRRILDEDTRARTRLLDALNARDDV